MIFPSPVSGGDITRARSDFYWSRTFVCLNDNEVIFRAQAAQDYTDEIILEIEYDNVDIGAFADVVPGMTVLISPTTSPRDAIYRGRVADELSATILPIDENATAVTTGMYLIVIADAELKKVVRRGDLRDGRFVWSNLPPMIDGLPGCIVLYDSDNDGSVAYTPSQTGIMTAEGATETGWLWTISGGGTSSISDPVDDHPLLTFQAGYHYLVNVVLEDSNGVLHRQFMHVYAITRTFAAPVVLPVVAGSIANDLNSGFSASLTAYGGVNNQLDASHIAVFKVERWGDNTAAPVLSNLRFTGRLRNESIVTEGSSEAGQLQRVSFTAESITAQMSHLSSPNDIVRNVAAPDEFGEIENPSVYRMLVYYLSTYSTLLSLGGFTAGDNLTLDWLVGGEPVSIDGGYLKDVITSVGERIHATPNYAPDGSIHIEQLASYKQDRSGIPTIMDFALTDIRQYELDRDASRTTAQVTAYGGAWDSTANLFVLYTASAPTVPYGDGEVRESNRELLTADASTTDAIDELKIRCGNDFAYNNSKPLLRLLLRGCWNWLLASGYVRYAASIPALSNLRAIPYTNADFWQLQSVTVTINPDGTDDTNAELVAETEFTDAQSIASQLPENADPPNPIFPVLSDYPAFPDSATWGYPTDDPDAGELQPIDAYSGYVGNSPFPPDQAAAAGNNQPTPNCKSFQVNMRNAGTTNSPWLTANGIPYTLNISGFGSIGAALWRQHFNFVSDGNGGFTALAAGTYSAGVGWIQGQFNSAGIFYTGLQISRIFSSSNIVLVRATGNINPTGGGGSLGTQFILSRWIGGIFIDQAIQNGVSGNVSIDLSGAITADEVQLFAYAARDGSGYVAGTATGFSVTIYGTGTNPFGGAPAAPYDADAYYLWATGDDSQPEVFAATEGLLIDGAKPAVIPPYDASHEYSVPFTGTGNAIQAAYALDDYTNVANRLLTLQLCRNP